MKFALSGNIIRDLERLFLNVNALFGYFGPNLEQSVLIGLLNTSWKKSGLNYFERRSIIVGFGNYISTLSHNTTMTEAVGTGWKDLFEYYELEKSQSNISSMNLNKCEEHYITSIVVLEYYLKYFKIKKIDAMEIFFTTLDPYMKVIEEIDSGEIELDDETLNYVFTFEKLALNAFNIVEEKNYSHPEFNYYQQLVQNTSNFISNFIPAYENLHEIIQHNADNWRHGNENFFGMDNGDLVTYASYNIKL